MHKLLPVTSGTLAPAATVPYDAVHAHMCVHALEPKKYGNNKGTCGMTSLFVLLAIADELWEKKVAAKGGKPAEKVMIGGRSVGLLSKKFLYSQGGQPMAHIPLVEH